MKTIPLSKLPKSCKKYDIVAAEWPDGIPVTRASIKRAGELGIDINSAAAQLLPEKQFREYEQR